MKYYCQNCGHSFVDIPANPFPQACKCGGCWWASFPPCGKANAGTDFNSMTVPTYYPILLKGGQS